MRPIRPVRLVPFPEPVAIGGGWYRRIWVCAVDEHFVLESFRPPPPAGLELQAIVVSINRSADGVIVSVDSVRRDDPHDLAYASLVIKRLLGDAALGTRINGALANPIARLAVEREDRGQ